jgi:hypothetical protein
MTVRELIEDLQKQDQDARVMLLAVHEDDEREWQADAVCFNPAVWTGMRYCSKPYREPFVIVGDTSSDSANSVQGESK